MKVDKCKVIYNEHVIQSIYRMSVDFAGEQIRPGQFFMLKTLNNEFLLPRPISVNDADDSSVTFLYRAEGAGTVVMSEMRPGDRLQVFGPLGNGFDVQTLKGRTAVVGGGIGIAPLLYLIKKLGATADVYLGFKDETYEVAEFEAYAKNVIVVTEDGSSKKKGFVTEWIDYSQYDNVAVCGPEIMMNKVIAASLKAGVDCYASLERRMACGVGACLGCVAETVSGNRRVCKDGPVFSGAELILPGGVQ